MAINFALFVVFVASACSAGAMVWRKFPMLLETPDATIESSFRNHPSRVHWVLAPVRQFIVSRRYGTLYRSVLVWTLHHVRMWLVSLERFVSRMLGALKREEEVLSATEERYWSELKQWKQNSHENGIELPKVVLTSDPSAQKLQAPTDLSTKKFLRSRKPVQKVV